MHRFSQFAFVVCLICCVQSTGYCGPGRVRAARVAKPKVAAHQKALARTSKSKAHGFRPVVARTSVPRPSVSRLGGHLHRLKPHVRNLPRLPRPPKRRAPKVRHRCYVIGNRTIRIVCPVAESSVIVVPDTDETSAGFDDLSSVDVWIESDGDTTVMIAKLQNLGAHDFSSPNHPYSLKLYNNGNVFAQTRFYELASGHSIVMRLNLPKHFEGEVTGRVEAVSRHSHDYVRQN